MSKVGISHVYVKTTGRMIRASKGCMAIYFIKTALLIFGTAFILSGCLSSSKLQNVAESADIEALFTVTTGNDTSTVRAILRGVHCPAITWDLAPPIPMNVRAPASTVPKRSGSAQPDAKEAVFDVLTCEADWPSSARSATVAGRTLSSTRKIIEKIVIIADTGCRMKASENAFQPCNDRDLWPFARIAQSAAAIKPDLVVHIGDIHYRESPCPVSLDGCSKSPWGYGFDAWQADFFTPAAPLLALAPWLFVRGNHESCDRAGQGWFRFLDQKPIADGRRCDLPSLDETADFSEPYGVKIGGANQLIVFDSSKSSGKPYLHTDNAYLRYAAQIKQVATIASRAEHNFFLSHHPIFAFAPLKQSVTAESKEAKAGGSQGLQSAFASIYPKRLLPENISVLMHGHIHLFEAMSFSSPHPVSIVMGNSGSQTEGIAPKSVPAATTPYPGAVVSDYAGRSEYGFALLEKIGTANASHWRLTEFDVNGKPMIECDLQNAKMRCKPI